MLYNNKHIKDMNIVCIFTTLFFSTFFEENRFNKYANRFLVI